MARGSSSEPGKRRLSVQASCEAAIGQGHVVQRGEIDVGCLDADARGCGRARGARRRDDAGGLDALIAVDERETVDCDLLAVVANVRDAVRRYRPGHLAAVESELREITSWVPSSSFARPGWADTERV